jgi:hypothetical protein
MSQITRFYWTGTSVELFSSQFAIKKNLSQKSSQCVSILSICDEEMKFLAIFLRHASLKRKKIKRKQDFSESPEYFKMRKLVSLTFWFLTYRFFIKVISILNWTLGSQVKNFYRKPEENFESCSAVGDQKTWYSKIAFFIWWNFLHGDKKKLNFNFSTHIIPKVIFIFPQISKKSLNEILFHWTRLNY